MMEKVCNKEKVCIDDDLLPREGNSVYLCDYLFRQRKCLEQQSGLHLFDYHF